MGTDFKTEAMTQLLREGREGWDLGRGTWRQLEVKLRKVLVLVLGGASSGCSHWGGLDWTQTVSVCVTLQFFKRVN